jgi:hypothetical protein
VIVAAIGGALPIADRDLLVARCAMGADADAASSSDEREMGRSEEKNERTNILNGLWYLCQDRSTLAVAT